MTPTAQQAGSISRQRGQSKWLLIAVLGGLALLALVVFFPGSAPDPVPAPMADDTDEPGGETVAPAETAEQRGDTAREIVAAMKASGIDIDYADAYARAGAFHAEGKLADAQLLYFFAARGGNADAAFTLASMYDPLHHGEQPTLMNKPDMVQAFQWYTQASSAGIAAAGERLTALRQWTEQAAASGDIQAEQLLLQWE
ncbi:MAG: hypothetical protein AAFN78_05225 [Pseudomonadota bacterium]